MRFIITGDTDSISGLGPLIYGVSGPARKHFVARDYGTGLLGVVVVLMCQDPNLKLKQRVRFAKTERKLYLDVMLGLEQMRRLDPKDRKQVVGERMLDEIRIFLKKYSFPEFDAERFLDELENWWGRPV